MKEIDKEEFTKMTQEKIDSSFDDLMKKSPVRFPEVLEKSMKLMFANGFLLGMQQGVDHANDILAKKIHFNK